MRIPKLFVLAFLFLIHFESYGQAAFWGVKAGGNFCKVGALEVNRSGIYPGFHLGVFGTFVVNDRFSFTHELLYSQRGVNLTINDSVSFKQGFGYIEIPWSVNYHLSSAMFFSLGVQPSLSTYLKAPIYDTVRIYNKSNTNPIDVSVFLGAAGYLSTKLGMGARINMSVVDAFDLNDKGKNVMLQVYLSYAVNRTGKGRRGGGGLNYFR